MSKDRAVRKALAAGLLGTVLIHMVLLADAVRASEGSHDQYPASPPYAKPVTVIPRRIIHPWRRNL